MSPLIFNTATSGSSGFRSWFQLRSRPNSISTNSDDALTSDTSEARKEPAPGVAAPEIGVIEGGRLSAADYDAWLNHLRTRKISQMRRGASLAEEYARWMAQRSRMRA